MIQYLYIAAGFSARGGFNKKQYPPAARAVEKGTKRFMKWVYKLERKFGRICIPHLMLVIIAGQAMVYLANLLNPDILLLSRFSLNWAAVMHGEVWRLLTFVFIPQSTSPLGLVLTLYFYYLIGNTLENTWGDFQFNVYYLCGMLGAILAAALTGYGTSYYINLSLFFAFAMLYPDFQVLLFFIIPIKMKYMALFSGALCLIDLLMEAGAPGRRCCSRWQTFFCFSAGISSARSSRRSNTIRRAVPGRTRTAATGADTGNLCLHPRGSGFFVRSVLK